MPAQFDTSEFRLSDGPGQHNAASAWLDGFTGAGVTIAVIDTGIDPDNPEFAGRLSAASTDIFGTRGLEGPDDHGNLVSLVAAAGRDDTGILGMAWNSTVLAIRADEPGSCAGDNLQNPNSDCGFTDTAIAQSIAYAVANDARVINISLGGPGGITVELENAIRDAVTAGALVVVAAGNDGQGELTDFARQFANAGNGGVIVAGSVDEQYVISDFSNRPGANPAFFLAARGEAICCVYENGEIFVDDEGFAFLFSGTSFAAPQIAGAAALLAQAFPHLTGTEIAEILFESAFDAGVMGDDGIYGQGILNIAAAFQPIGTTQLAGESTALALGDSTATGSPAMGDAFTTASIPTLITDRYQRAFQTDLAGTLRGAEVPERLHGAIGRSMRHLSAASTRASVAFSIDATGRQPPRAEALHLRSEDAEQARVLAARVALQLDPEMQLGFGYRQGAEGLVAGLQGRERPAFMIATGAAGQTGIIAQTDTAIALRRQLGAWGLTVSAETGSTITAANQRRAAELRGRRAEEDLASFGVALDRRFGSLDAALGLTWTGEDRTVLGARFHEGFGLAGSDTLFLDADMGLALAEHWRLGAGWRQGFTRLRRAALLADGSDLTSSAWSLDLQRTGVFADFDRLALRVSQPLRVSTGGLNLSLPSSFSYETLQPGYSVQRLNLAPEGRELAGELTWRGELLGGEAAASVFIRREPGHYENAPDDLGAAFRWSRRF
ncbi:S8 family serine peptidase [Aurantiacibacter sp. MUD11]|uniref:S8 family peptidase n=1 Tax=Aurantiacibacter sp. MUD11 TaxID=3003265 RepID=UPI0022AA682E|nr:S8 family peptidase [Aurantiacibacter sp. MUD11]WAT17671.1 S8 family serine peptidase [Aurantiacibacter sp. MUD11]